MAFDWSVEDIQSEIEDVRASLDFEGQRKAEEAAQADTQKTQAELEARTPKPAPRDFGTLVQIGVGALGSGAALYFQLAPGFRYRRISTVIAAAITLALLIAIERRRHQPKIKIISPATTPTTTQTTSAPAGSYSGPIADLARQVEEYELWFDKAPW